MGTTVCLSRSSEASVGLENDAVIQDSKEFPKADGIVPPPPPPPIVVSTQPLPSNKQASFKRKDKPTGIVDSTDNTKHR